MAKNGNWHRYLDGEWSRLGPGTEGAVVASDGALWGWDHDYETHTVRLVRQTGDGVQGPDHPRHLRDIRPTAGSPDRGPAMGRCGWW